MSQRNEVYLELPFVPLIPLVTGTPEKLDTIKEETFVGEHTSPSVFSGITRFQSGVSHYLASCEQHADTSTIAV